MPIFEYLCQECGTRFEVLLASSGAKATCTTCGSAKVDKQFSTFSPSVAASSSPCADSGCGKAGTGCGGACPMGG
jgi:putative FmdB family regulatory protein